LGLGLRLGLVGLGVGLELTAAVPKEMLGHNTFMLENTKSTANV
jgi:hypothetical protein